VPAVVDARSRATGEGARSNLLAAWFWQRCRSNTSIHGCSVMKNAPLRIGIGGPSARARPVVDALCKRCANATGSASSPTASSARGLEFLVRSGSAAATAFIGVQTGVVRTRDP